MEQDIENTLHAESAASSLGQTCFFQKQKECESWLQLCHLLGEALIFYLAHAHFSDSGFRSKISVHLLWGLGVAFPCGGLFLGIQIVLFY